MIENSAYDHNAVEDEHQLSLDNEKTPLTPEIFIADNQSELAQATIAEFNENKRGNRLVHAILCGDAREETPNPYTTYSDRRIATGVNLGIAGTILNSQPVRWGIIGPHYDSIESQPGQSPIGCGGLGAKAEIVRNGTEGTHHDPLYEFIDGNVINDDLIANSIYYMRELTSRAHEGKYVVVAPQDHRTGEMNPILWAEQKRGMLVTYMPSDLKIPIHGRFNPQELYANGMPSMDLGMLPDEAAAYFEEYEKYRARLYARKPELVDNKRIQNPSMIIFSTDLRDPKVWLPGLFEDPNTGFRLTVPRRKVEEDVVIGEKDKHIAFSQAGYVLGHNVENAENPDGAFHSTNTIVAFKASFDRAVEFVEELTSFEQEYATAHQRPMWHTLPNRKIIVGETQRGKITRIGEIDFKIQDGRVVKFEPKEHRFNSRNIA